MAVSSSTIAVTTSAGLVLTGQAPAAMVADDMPGSSVLIANSGAVTVFLGGPAVTTGNGFPLAIGASVALDARSTDSIYAIAASAGQLSVLQVGV